MKNEIKPDDKREQSILIKAIADIFIKNGFSIDVAVDWNGPYIESEDNNDLYVSIEDGCIFIQKQGSSKFGEIPLSDPDSLSEDRILGLWDSLNMNDKEIVLAEVKKVLEKFIDKEKLSIIWEKSAGPTDPFWPCLNCDIKHDTIYIYVEEECILMEILGHAGDDAEISLADPDALSEDKILGEFLRLCNDR